MKGKYLTMLFFIGFVLLFGNISDVFGNTSDGNGPKYVAIELNQTDSETKSIKDSYNNLSYVDYLSWIRAFYLNKNTEFVSEYFDSVENEYYFNDIKIEGMVVSEYSPIIFIKFGCDENVVLCSDIVRNNNS